MVFLWSVKLLIWNNYTSVKSKVRLVELRSASDRLHIMAGSQPPCCEAFCTFLVVWNLCVNINAKLHRTWVFLLHKKHSTSGCTTLHIRKRCSSISLESHFSAVTLLFLTVEWTVRLILLAMSTCFSPRSAALIRLCLSDSEISYLATRCAKKKEKKSHWLWFGLAVPTTRSMPTELPSKVVSSPK